MGFDHLSGRTNCQDAFAFGAVGPYVFGVVCDGCGSGKHTEVGANLMAPYAARRLAEAIKLKQQCGNGLISDIPPNLFVQLVNFVRWNLTLNEVAESAEDGATFINDYWLCTVLGFIIAPHSLLVFSAGDGSYVVNDIVEVISSPDNAPHYLSYNCVSEGLLTDQSATPRRFEVEMFNADSIQRLMIATDGFLTDRKWVREFDARRGTWDIKHDPDGNPVPLPTIQGQQWGLKGETGVNRFLNQKSDLGYFTDDVALITVERQA